jgi:hypothetical protein
MRRGDELVASDAVVERMGGDSTQAFRRRQRISCPELASRRGIPMSPPGLQIIQSARPLDGRSIVVQ